MTVMDLDWLTATDAPWWAVGVFSVGAAALTFWAQNKAEKRRAKREDERAKEEDVARVADRYGHAQLEACSEFISAVFRYMIVRGDGPEPRSQAAEKMMTSFARVHLLMPENVSDAAEKTWRASRDDKETMATVGAKMTQFRLLARNALPLVPGADSLSKVDGVSPADGAAP